MIRKTGIIVTTTNSVEGKKIGKYLNIVKGAGLYAAIGAIGATNPEKYFGSAFEKAKTQMIESAPFGTDAIIGVKVDTISINTSSGGLGKMNSNMISVIVIGTAVEFERDTSNKSIPPQSTAAPKEAPNDPKPFREQAASATDWQCISCECFNDDSDEKCGYCNAYRVRI